MEYEYNPMFCGECRFDIVVRQMLQMEEGFRTLVRCKSLDVCRIEDIGVRRFGEDFV